MCHPTDVGHDSPRSDKKARTEGLLPGGFEIRRMRSVLARRKIGVWPIK
jgi:hypothetical protein